MACIFPPVVRFISIFMDEISFCVFGHGRLSINYSNKILFTTELFTKLACMSVSGLHFF